MRPRGRPAPPPKAARTALFAVTTGLPARRADSINSCAGCSPPISSTTMSTSGRTAKHGAVGLEERGRNGRRPGAVDVGHGDADQFETDPRAGRDVVLACHQELRQRAPHIPAAQEGDPHRGRGLRIGCRRGHSFKATGCLHRPKDDRDSRVQTDHVLETSPSARPRARAAVGHENDGGPGHLVVVRGHGIAVGAGDRGGRRCPPRAAPSGTNALGTTRSPLSQCFPTSLTGSGRGAPTARGKNAS